MTATILQFPAAKQEPELDIDQYQAEMRLRGKLERAVSDCGGRSGIRYSGVPIHAANYLRVRYSVRDLREIPAEHLQEAIRIVGLMEQACMEFRLFVGEAEKWLMDEVIAAGTPWTPAIKAKFTRRLRQQLPERPDWYDLAKQFPAATERKAQFED